jgi:GGDEF domain-containing protein
MKALQRSILEQLVAGSAEPIVVAQISSPDWPVVLCNPAFESVTRTDDVEKQPFADVIEQLVGRELALEISETIRTGQETTIPVEIRNQEFLLVLKPIEGTAKGNSKYYAGFLRVGAGPGAIGDQEVQQALLKAKRQIRDLSRDDPSTLALVAFTLDDFDKYREVFGRHAADTCQRRVAQAIRRCLKRASDVAARVSSDSGDKLVVLSHSSDETGVHEFALKIAASVRELGLHHPRSRVAKFVTVSYQTIVKEAGADKMNAEDFLKAVLD